MKMFALVTAAMVTAAVPALAQTGGGTPGAMTRAQVQARVAQKFATTDANRDGFVTRTEADAQRNAMRGQRGANGAKSLDEHFAELDRDRNGSISRAEFDARHEGGKEARAERRGERMERRAERMERRGARGIGFNQRQFERSDANKDACRSPKPLRARSPASRAPMSTMTAC